jgi:hypothetical protein
MNMTPQDKNTAGFPSRARSCGALLAVCAAAMVVTGCGGGGDGVSTASAAPSATVLKTSLETAASVAAPVASDGAGTTVATAQNGPDLCD